VTFPEILRLPARNFKRHSMAVLVSLALIVSAVVYPSDMKNDYSTPRGGAQSALVLGVEDYGRHINTLLPIATAVVLRDWTGLKQIAVIIVAGTLASHGPKRLLNNVVIGDTRLGQRPYSPDSRHNMPSGHSTLAGAGAYIMIRRYGLLWALLVVPIMLLTMYARVMLDMHTISAVLAGAGTGMLVSALFTTKMRDAGKRFMALFGH
jgi:lipid A 1-phosphatase